VKNASNALVWGVEMQSWIGFLHCHQQTALGRRYIVQVCMGSVDVQWHVPTSFHARKKIYHSGVCGNCGCAMACAYVFSCQAMHEGRSECDMISSKWLQYVLGPSLGGIVDPQI
jgi:hypothetical protein